MIDDAYFARFETPKYRRANPIKRRLISNFLARVHAYFERVDKLVGEPMRVLEVGVGEGFISGGLSERFEGHRFVGLDLCEQDIRRAREKFPRLDARVGDAYELQGLGEAFDMVICAEVLEHLDSPERALAQIAALEPRYCLFSVPHEPLFMLSNLAAGNNIRRMGNDPGHINHFTPATFRQLVQGRFEPIELTKAYPWLLALVAGRR